jgi:hypothetical protein
MTRTRSGKTFLELLVMVVVLAGLGGMLAHAVQKVRAAADTPPGRIEPPRATASISVKAPHKHAHVP